MARKILRENKGTFGEVRLPVAKKYLRPISRHPLVVAGALLVAAAAFFVSLDFFLRDARFLSNGPLSSNHATLDDDCAACHDAPGEVSSENCSVCHEKLGDQLGVYTWPAHIIYRSADFQRHGRAEHETSCAACHLEHRGRETAITQVDDARCRSCHPFQSFNQGHPQFEFAAEGIPDDTALTFPHILHVREVKKESRRGDVERTCLYCHNAESDGKGFEPISFEHHCDRCHLNAGLRTEPLPVAAGGGIGVETLETIRRRREPGTRWAQFMGSGEFRDRGDEVTKSPIYHQDPWILENLRLLRRRLMEDPGLADLLKASADVPPHDLPALYEEAITTLEGYSLELRARPEPAIRQELGTVDRLLAELRRALRDPLTPLDETRFLLALERRADLSVDDEEAIENLVFDLTAHCQRCHLVEDATVIRPLKDQSTLRRAEFDHRAHILQVRCLECHTRIPIGDYLEDLSSELDVDPNIDHAGIQNLPAIETCQECHTPKLASNRCLTCHFFHPNKSRRSEMLLYLDSTLDSDREGSDREGSDREGSDREGSDREGSAEQGGPS